MNILGVFSFLTRNWGLFSEVLTKSLTAVTKQSERSSTNSAKRKAAFEAVREIVPAKVDDNWINLALELALALLRWRGVV
jgi:hypothetical protein